MNPEDYKKCSKCLIYKLLDHFQKKRNDCKECRKITDKTNYSNKNDIKIKDKIKERIPFRNEFFKKFIQEENDLEYYNKVYIPFEKYEDMKKQPSLYSFCETKFIRDIDREHFKDEYENKYFLDCVMMNNKTLKTAYIIHII